MRTVYWVWSMVVFVMVVIQIGLAGYGAFYAAKKLDDEGSTIDFLNTIQESGFKIDNPNAVSSCGCGHSFQVDEAEKLPEGTHVGGCGSGCSH